MDAALPLLPLPEPDEAEEKAFWALQRKKAEPRAGRDAALNHSILRLSIGGGTYVHDLKNGVAFGCSMPGTDYHIHDADEFIPVDELVLSAEILTQAILMLCQ